MGSVYKDKRLVKHKKQEEQSIHARVCTYLRHEYPHVIFRTDGGGLKLSKNQAITFARMQYCKGWPDLQILNASRGYRGLFLELKKEGVTIYLKKTDGSGNKVMVANPHMRQQKVTHDMLKREGFCAGFVVGYDHAIRVVDWYMCRPKNETLF